MFVEKRSLQGVFKNKQTNNQKGKKKVSGFNSLNNVVAASLSEFPYLCYYRSDLIPAML